MKKRVALIIPKLNGGGAERAASSLSFDLVKHYSLIIVAWDLDDVTYPHRGHIVRLSPSSKTKIGKILVNVRRVFELRHIKKKLKIDASISLLVIPNLLNVLTRNYGKCLISIRNSLVELKDNAVERFLAKFACKHADRIVAVSQLLSAELQDQFGIAKDKIAVINNPCDFRFLNELTDEKQEYCEWPYIVTMGRLERQKGHTHLIHAFAKFHKKCPDIHLIILGDGSLKKSLERESAAVAVEKFVHFPGYVTAPHRIVKNAEFFVLPSLWEGIANALLEAMACGKAVISTDCASGPREILYRKPDIFKKTQEIEMADYGVLVPDFLDESSLSIERKENILAEAMIQMNVNHSLRESFEKKVAERLADFSREKILSQWEGEIS